MGRFQAEARVDDAFAPAAPLLAEIERLKREVAIARARVAELEARADVDSQLDILNRRGFERELERARAHVQRYGTQAALMFIDLDGFKAINDHYGHGVGDAVLKAAVRELSAHVRASDIIGRLGGDEFGVLIWRVDEAQAGAKARELEILIGGVAVMHGQARIQAAASVGTAPLLAGSSATEIIAAADRAMYLRKEQRRG
jgi:diguanylate cyclase (GGDEF)-like protein